MQNYGRSTRAALLVFIAAGTLLFTLSCGSTPHNAYAYVIEWIPSVSGMGAPTGGITQLRVANDGTLTQIGPANLGSNQIQGRMLVHPSGKYLFLSSNDGNTYEFMIGSDGTLTANPAATLHPLATMDYIGPIGFTPDGRFVATIGVNFTEVNSWWYDSYTLSLFKLDSDGIPTLINTLPAGSDLNGIALDPSGKYLYTTPQLGTPISEYAVSSDGLTFVGSTPVNAGYGCTITISPKEFLYCTSQSGEVVDFAINPSTGALTEMGSFAGEGYFLFDPSGQYAYGPLHGYSTSQLKVDETTGLFTSNGPDIPGIVVSALDPSGKLVLGLSGANSVSSFVIGSDGQLTPGGTVALSQSSYAQSIAIARQ